MTRPHSGNILVNEQGLVCFIDFGLVGRLRPDQKSDLISLVLAVITRDVATISRIFLRMGTPLKRVNIQDLRAEITRILDAYVQISSFEELKSKELADEFIQTAQKYQIQLASEYTLLMKTCLTIEGIVRRLNPDVDVMAIAKPYLRRVMNDRLSPTALLSETYSHLAQLPDLLKQLPGQVDQFLHDTQTGNLQVRAMTPELDHLPQVLHFSMSRLLLGMFAVSMTFITTVLFIFAPDATHRTWLIVAALLASVFSWSTLFFSHFVRFGRPYRLQALLQFFRR